MTSVISTPTLSIIIPAYNESKRILPTLEKIEKFRQLQSYTTEIIVVDDASTDGTSDVVETFIADKPFFRLVRNEKNIGKGGSVQRGMLLAEGAYRLFSDADMSTPIEEVQKFLGLKYVDVVIGSRRVTGAHLAKRQPVLREAAGRIFSVLVRFLVLRGFLDTQCGFKMFTGAVAEKVFRRQTIMRFGFDVEILFVAKKIGCEIREVGVHWEDSPFTRVHLFRDSTAMFLDLLRIRRNDAKGRYK